MAEVPSLKEAWTVFKDQEVVVLMIDMTGQTPETAAGYYRDQLGGGDHLYAGEGGVEVLKRYELRELGTTVVIGRDGIVTFRDSETTEPTLLNNAYGKRSDDAPLACAHCPKTRRRICGRRNGKRGDAW